MQRAAVAATVATKEPSRSVDGEFSHSGSFTEQLK